MSSIKCDSLTPVKAWHGAVPASDAGQPKRPGRKPLPAGEGKTARVDLRVLPADKAAWQAKAGAAGLTLQAWVEARLRAEA